MIGDAPDRRQRIRAGWGTFRAPPARFIFGDPMPDQNEILLNEIAVLRGEVAHLHTMVEQADESLRNLNLTLLERINALMGLIQKLELRLPALPQ